MQAEHLLCVLVAVPPLSEFGLAPNILSSVCSVSQGISRSPFHVKLWAGLTASILFVMTTLFICVPKFAFRGSSGCIHQVLPTSRVSASLHSAGCVSFSSISPGVTFPFQNYRLPLLCRTFHLAGQVLLLVTHLVECHMGFSLEDKEQHHYTVAGLPVARSLMPWWWWALKILMCWPPVTACVLFTYWSWTEELAVSFCF